MQTELSHVVGLKVPSEAAKPWMESVHACLGDMHLRCHPILLYLLFVYQTREGAGEREGEGQRNPTAISDNKSP